MKFKWRNKITEIKLRLDRGNNLVYWIKNILIGVASIKIIFELNTEISIIVGILGVIGVYLLGSFDMDFLKIFQTEIKLLNSKYNKPLTNILKKVNKIK